MSDTPLTWMVLVLGLTFAFLSGNGLSSPMHVGLGALFLLPYLLVNALAGSAGGLVLPILVLVGAMAAAALRGSWWGSVSIAAMCFAVVVLVV